MAVLALNLQLVCLSTTFSTGHSRKRILNSCDALMLFASQHLHQHFIHFSLDLSFEPDMFAICAVFSSTFASTLCQNPMERAACMPNFSLQNLASSSALFCRMHGSCVYHIGLNDIFRHFACRFQILPCAVATLLRPVEQL